MKGDLKMRKLTKRQITAAEKLMQKMDVAVKLHLDVLVDGWAKAYVEGKDGTADYYAGAIWGVLETMQMLGVITLKQYFLLGDYFHDKRWAKCDELRENGAA